jgi:outer membrane protein
MRIFWRHAVCLSLILGGLAAAPSCFAQSPDSGGLTAGTILLRGRVIGIFPEDRNSTITPIGGQIKVDDTASPEVDLSYFVTDHIAVEGETGILHTTLSAQNTALGDIDIGKVWSVPITLVAQYHLLPHARFNPYFGAGMDVSTYFGEQAAGGLVQNFTVDTQVGAVLEAGADYQIAGRWYGNIDVKQLFLGAQAHIDNGEVDAKNDLDPLVVGLGIGCRF